MLLHRCFLFFLACGGISAVAQVLSPLQVLQRMAAAPEEQVSVSAAALLLDEAVHPGVQTEQFSAALDQMAGELKPALERAETPRTKLEVVSEFIYERWQFANTEVLPPDVFVGFHEVLEKRQWNCFGLVVLYIALGERLELPLKMVSGRGHVFVVWDAETPLYVETTQGGTVYESKEYLKDYLPFPCLRVEDYQVLGEKETVSVLLSQTALALQHQGRLQPAVSCFRVALEFDARNAEAHAGLGFVALAQRDVLAAGEAFKKAIEADPAFREAYGGLGTMLHAAGHTAAAVQTYRKAVELCPEEPAAVFNLAQLLYESGEHAQAAEQFQRYVKLAPDDVEGFVGLALALEDSGNLEAARQAYEEALRLKPGHVDASINLGYVLERQQADAQAEAQYLTVLKAAPENALAWSGMGRIATRRNDFTAAEAAFQKALAAAPPNGSIHLDAGHLYRAQGNRKRALESYQQAMALDAQDREAYTAAAEVLRELGRAEEAEALMQKAPKE